MRRNTQSYFQTKRENDKKRLSGVKVKIINKAKHNFGLPCYATKGSSGMDVRASLDEFEVIKPGRRKLISTGLFMEIPQGYEIQIRPRSGLSLKTSLRVANAPGTIDSNYRGEICVIVVNLSNDSVDIEDGEKIAQIEKFCYDKKSLEYNFMTIEEKRGEA